MACAAFFAAAATEPLIPKLLQVALDEGFVKEPTFPLWSVPLVLISLFAVRGGLSFVGAYMLSRGVTRAVVALREDLAAALLRADASVFTRITPGSAVVKVINDPQQMASHLGGALVTLLRDGSTVIALLVYLFWQNWALTLISLVSVPLLALSVRAIQRRILRLGGEGYGAQMQLVAVVNDIARAWRVIRCFGAQDHEKGRLAAGARLVQRYAIKSAAANAMLTPVSQVISSIGVAVIVTLALYQAQSGTATTGSFVAYITGLLLLVSRTRQLTDLSKPVLAAQVLARAVLELLNEPSERDRGVLELGRARGDIVLEGVCVAYPGAESDALSEVSLHIPAGSTVALVGPSGSGKSTLANMLLGFVEPHRGSYTLDGIPAFDIRRSDLRRQFAVVSQDVVLFDGSIAENVSYGGVLDAERVEACLRAAALWSHVAEMPGGIHAPIGVDGCLLSGGQRQRLAIARALYKNAPVWVLDEATSALDSHSENAIQQALESGRGHRTVIVIAHRLSTIRTADKIVVLDGGRIVEAGTHAALLERDQTYAAMVRVQTLSADVTAR